MYSENVIVVGGVGYAIRNKSFCADQHIYGPAITYEKEKELAQAWLEVLMNAVEIAKCNHTILVVLSHMPPSDWIDEKELPNNCTYFYGHTHKNIMIDDNDSMCIYADNQVGYDKDHFSFCLAMLNSARNPFSNEKDGYRSISVVEYMEFHRYMHLPVPGTGIIERMLKKKGKLFVVKHDGYYGFFLSTSSGINICNGGQVIKIGLEKSIEKYNNLFLQMVEKYLRILSPLRNEQEQISRAIRNMGGSGRIHGTIVDIDYYNHIMINAYDGSITYYYSPFFGSVETYSTLGELIHAQLPELEKRNSGNVELIPTGIPSGEKDKLEPIDIKNSPYTASRKIEALQRLFDKHILRAWNDSILDNSHQ